MANESLSLFPLHTVLLPGAALGLRVFEARYFALIRRALKLAGSRRLVLAGGCALNSLANGRIFDNCDVEEVWIQPAAGDAGTSLGAALWAHHGVLGGSRDPAGGEMVRHGKADARTGAGDDRACPVEFGHAVLSRLPLPAATTRRRGPRSLMETDG